MHFTESLPDWDILLIMVPFLGAMALGMFGLDEKIARGSKPRSRSRRAFCGIDPDGGHRLSDPDGNPCGQVDSAHMKPLRTIPSKTPVRPVRASLIRRGAQI